MLCRAQKRSDEIQGFFSTEIPKEKKNEKLKAGAGSQRKSKVMVIAESTPAEKEAKKGQKPKVVKHIKMIVIPDEKAKTIDAVAGKVIIAISNAKTQLADMHHGIKPELVQEYLNEFCYKFSRRYFGEDLFDRLVMIATSYRTDFEHRIYK